jgi:predicted component of type VI protein secretion system
MEENMPPTFRLVIRTGPTAGKVHVLDKPEMTVGRDLNTEIVINDPEISRRHARFFLQGSTYLVEDLGSTNGTFVNNQRLSGPHMLRPGEVITFGERITAAFEVTLVDADATQVSTTARQVEQAFQPPNPSPQQVPPAYVQQTPLPPEPVYTNQVPYSEPPAKSGSSRVLIIVAIILLLLFCVCVAVGLYLAPKELWCMLPVWPEGACP